MRRRRLRGTAGALLALVLAMACGGGEQGRQAGAGAAPPARSPGPGDQYIAAGGVAPSGPSARNPHEGDRRSVAEGARIYVAMNCDGCHGSDGAGWVGPSLADGRWRYGGAAGAVYRSISDGRPHGMPAFGGILAPDAVWKLVTYLQALTPPPDVPTESWR